VKVHKIKGSTPEHEEEKAQEVYISRKRWTTPSGRIPTKLGKYARLADVIKRDDTCSRYNLRGFGAVMC